MFCVLCLDYVRRFLRMKQRDWNKDQMFSGSDQMFSDFFLLLFKFFTVDIFFPTKNSKYSGMVPFKTLNFLFLKRDIWELQEPFTVLRTVRSESNSHGSLIFSHRAILEAKRTTKMSGSRFSRSDRTVRSGFQNHVDDWMILIVNNLKKANLPSDS